MTLLKKYNDLSKRRKALEKSKAKAWSEFQKLHADAKYLKALGMMLKIREIEEELTLLEKQLVRRVSLLSSVPTVRSQISQEEYEMMLSEFKEEMDRAGKNIRGTMAASARNLVSKASDLTTKILADAESKRKQYRADVKSGKRTPVKRIKKVANDVKQAAIATAINAGATKAEAKQIGKEVAAATTEQLKQSVLQLPVEPGYVPPTATELKARNAKSAAAGRKVSNAVAARTAAENKRIKAGIPSETTIKKSVSEAVKAGKITKKQGTDMTKTLIAISKSAIQNNPLDCAMSALPTGRAPTAAELKEASDRWLKCLPSAPKAPRRAKGLPSSKYSINQPRIPGMMYPAVMDPRDLPQFELA